MDGPGRDRVAAVAGMLSVVAFVVGQYVAPALVWPAEQVGGLVASFYVNFEGRLLAEAILFGVASALFLVFLGGLWALLGWTEDQQRRLAPVVVAAGAVAIGLVLLQAAILTALITLEENSLGIRAQGGSLASRALFYLHGEVGDLALFPVRGVPGRGRGGGAAHRGAGALAGLGRGGVWAPCRRARRRLDRRAEHWACRPGGVPGGGGLAGGAGVRRWLATASGGQAGR